jgi:HEAT repeat protein
MTWRNHELSPIVLLAVAWFALGGCQSDGAPTKIVEGVDSPISDERVVGDQAPAAKGQATQAGADASSESLGAEIFTPVRTRGGQLRFADEGLHDNPAATGELLSRLDRETSSEVRVALVEALPRTGGDWIDGALARLSTETDPGVRKALVAIMPRAEPSAGARGIAVGLADADGGVRIEAALAAGSIPAQVAVQAGLIDLLSKALGGGEAQLRAAAARSLGILEAAGSFDAIRSLLGDPDARARLEALRALGRIDLSKAAALPSLRALRNDGDPKIARAAAALIDKSQH